MILDRKDANGEACDIYTRTQELIMSARECWFPERNDSELAEILDLLTIHRPKVWNQPPHSNICWWYSELIVREIMEASGTLVDLHTTSTLRAHSFFELVQQRVVDGFEAKTVRILAKATIRRWELLLKSPWSTDHPAQGSGGPLTNSNEKRRVP